MGAREALEWGRGQGRGREGRLGRERGGQVVVVVVVGRGGEAAPNGRFSQTSA